MTTETPTTPEDGAAQAYAAACLPDRLRCYAATLVLSGHHEHGEFTTLVREAADKLEAADALLSLSAAYRAAHALHVEAVATANPAEVTCLRCRQLCMKTGTAMNKLSSLALLIVLSACGPLPADDLDGSTSTSGYDSTSGESTGSTGAESTGEGSSSEAMGESTGGSTSEGSSGSGGEGMGSGSVEACWADECGEDMPCGKNLACLPHPLNGAMVCAASDCDPSAPCDGLTSACPVTIPQGVCILNETKHGWCYPQICVAVGDCAAGSDCVNGYCY